METLQNITLENQFAICPQSVLQSYVKAKSLHSMRKSVWQECYDYAYPSPKKPFKGLFDGTAPDSVDELASMLSSEIAPRNSNWMQYRAGQYSLDTDLDTNQTQHSTRVALKSVRDSNFQSVLHQALTDCIIAGTGIILAQPSHTPHISPLFFKGLPIQSVVLADSGEGRLDTLYYTTPYSYDTALKKYPALSQTGLKQGEEVIVLDVIRPCNEGYEHISMVLADKQSCILDVRHYAVSPFIAFRWQTETDEIYGRSPIMKALPDIKTANKVVELTLQNASISVTGIWQADDDGILNPDSIELTPGSIIPKAVGSAGLQPLKSAGDFNVSNLVLDTLQQRIRQSLLANVFTTTIGRTATEVQEQSLRSRQVLDAVFDRLVQELLTPLAYRITDILQSMGYIDVTDCAIDISSPIERADKLRQLYQVEKFLKTVTSTAGGDVVDSIIDVHSLLRWSAKEFGVPSEFIRSPLARDSASDSISDSASDSASDSVNDFVGGLGV